MPDLEHTYLDYDLALLRAIAEHAGVDLTASNPRQAATYLAAELQQPDAAELLLNRAYALHTEAPAALHALLNNGGRQPAASFIRRYGEPRPLGTAALTRERPWENPTNAAEALFYNGLIGRAFMESDTGPQEFFFIPSDLIRHMPPPTEALPNPATAVAPPEETGSAPPLPASSALVDDAVTLLAAVQRKPGSMPTAQLLSPYLRLPAFDFLLTILSELKLIAPDARLNPDLARPYLQATRAEQLRQLCNAWRDSQGWNDLLRVPSLNAEPDSWRNDPAAARKFVIRLCANLPVNEWRSVDSFADFVREHHPDFQRPAGDYDSWYIRDAASGEYLRGFEHWHKVDGALLKFIITGPMHWLGLTDVRQSPDAFRLTPIFQRFAADVTFDILERARKILLKPDGVMLVTRSVNRYDRFLAARIADWLPLSKNGETFPYRLCGHSLQAASAQGITAAHVVSFLRRACETPLPPAVLNAVERWGQHGLEVEVARAVVLRAAPEVISQLRQSPKSQKYLGESLGNSAVEVKNADKLRDALLELGLLSVIRLDDL